MSKTPQDLIDEAQGHRRTAKKALKSGDTDAARQSFQKAHQTLDTLESELETMVAPDPHDPMPGDRETAALYAELWGIRGGTYRDMAVLDEGAIQKAIEAYDEGAAFERDFKLQSTYNFVNQLVVRILSDAERLNDPAYQLTLKDRKGEDLSATTRDWLERADDHVASSVSRRNDKAWAHADLVLLGVLRGLPDVDARWRNFVAQVNSDGDEYPYESLLAVVRDLARLPLEEKPRLLELGEDLRQKLPSEKRGEPLDS